MEITQSEIGSRIEKLKILMEKRGIDISFIHHNPDLFYFTGCIQQGILVVGKDSSPRYFVRRYFDRARKESLIHDVVKIDSPVDILTGIEEEACHARVAALSLDVLPVTLYKRLSPLIEGKEVVDLTPLIREVRAVKSEIEVSRMRKSGNNLVKLMKKAGELLVEGKREIDLAGEIVERALKDGHGGFIRMRNRNQELPFFHILSGPSGAVGTYTDTPLGGDGPDRSFPVGPGTRVIGKREPVIVDMMWVEQGYITDMSRVFSLGGKIEDPEIERAHEVAIEILRNVEGMIRPGQRSEDVYLKSVEIAEREGLEECFMGIPGNRVKFLGHGLGVEVDEYPFIAEGINFIIRKGMTLALEPKFVFPGKGAVGIENTYLVGEEGLENLTEMEEGIIII
jgi:Xaa-Pro dipeptidase